MAIPREPSKLAIIKIKSLGKTSFKLGPADIKSLLSNDEQLTQEVTLSNEVILEAADLIRGQFREA